MTTMTASTRDVGVHPRLATTLRRGEIRDWDPLKARLPPRLATGFRSDGAVVGLAGWLVSNEGKAPEQISRFLDRKWRSSREACRGYSHDDHPVAPVPSIECWEFEGY